jgi:hypothetical protein
MDAEQGEGNHVLTEFESETRSMERALGHVPYASLRRLERSLKQLTLERQIYVRQTLLGCRGKLRSTPPELDLLEHMFDRWWIHGLATKLVMIARVVRLSEGEGWPGDPIPIIPRAGLVA